MLPFQALNFPRIPAIAAAIFSICIFNNNCYAGNMDVATRPAWAVPRSQAPNETELKRQFAEYLLYNPGDFEGAANSVYRNNFARSAIAEREWPYDPVVIEHQKAMLAQHGARHFLPTRETIVHNLWGRVQRDKTLEARDMVAVTRLLSELAGYIGKASDLAGNEASVVNQSISINFVEPEKKENAKIIDMEPLPDLNIRFAS